MDVDLQRWLLETEEVEQEASLREHLKDLPSGWARKMLLRLSKVGRWKLSPSVASGFESPVRFATPSLVVALDEDPQSSAGRELTLRILETDDGYVLDIRGSHAIVVQPRSANAAQIKIVTPKSYPMSNL